MLLDGQHDRRESVLVEKNDAFEVELRAEQVKENVLAVALVELTRRVGHLVEHGERLGGVRHAWHHLPHARLQLNHLLLQLFVFRLQLVTLFPRRSKFARHDLELVLGVFDLTETAAFILLRLLGGQLSHV